MRICIVSHYHFDCSISDFKYLSKYCEVDYYLLFNEKFRNGDAVDLTEYEDLKQGFVPREIVNDVVQNKLGNYIDNPQNVFFYVFYSQRKLSTENFRLFAGLGKFLKAKNYDAVHVVGQRQPYLALLHFVLRGIGRVHTLHESTAHESNEKLSTKLFLKYLAKSNIQIIFNSNTTYQRFYNFTHCDVTKCHIIPFGFLEHYRNHTAALKDIVEQKNTILFFGNIKPYKGVEYLIKAALIAIEIIPELKIIIAGRWYVDNLKETVSEHPNFKIIDRALSSEEIAGLMIQSRFVVCPYTSASQSGVTNAAYALYKPIIASNLDGLAEVIDDKKSGLLIPEKDEKALADAIVSLLKNEELLASMKDYIRDLESSERFSWDVIAQKTMDVYQKAIKQVTHE